MSISVRVIHTLCLALVVFVAGCGSIGPVAQISGELEGVAAGVEELAEGVDGIAEELIAGIAGIEGIAVGVDESVGGLSKDIQDLSKQLGRLDSRSGGFSGTIQDLSQGVNQLNAKVDNISGQVRRISAQLEQVPEDSLKSQQTSAQCIAVTFANVLDRTIVLGLKGAVSLSIVKFSTAIINMPLSVVSIPFELAKCLG